MSDDESLQACRALHGMPESQQMRHCSVICWRILLETVSTITGNTAIEEGNIVRTEGGENTSIPHACPYSGDIGKTHTK